MNNITKKLNRAPGKDLSQIESFFLTCKCEHVAQELYEVRFLTAFQLLHTLYEELAGWMLSDIYRHPSIINTDNE